MEYLRNSSNGKTLYPDASPENFTINQRELVFSLSERRDQAIRRPHHMLGSNSNPKVFSSVNMFPFFDSPTADIRDQHPETLRKEVRFVGIANLPYDATRHNQSANISIFTSGVQTIINSGPYRINAGQKVMWDFPKAGGVDPPAISFLPVNKMLFSTVPMDHGLPQSRSTGAIGVRVRDIFRHILAKAQLALGNAGAGAARGGGVGAGEMRMAKRARVGPVSDGEVNQHIANLMVLVREQASATEKGYTDALQRYTEAFCRKIEEDNSRVIGVALSSAEPGEEFDICLRSYGAF
jgi:hypothetical protein